MLLGYNTNGLQNHRLDEALRLLADEGYEAVALTPDVCHLDPFCATPREVDAIAALLAKLSLRPVVETGARFLLDPRHKHEPTLMTRDQAAVDRRIDFSARAARLGRDLGAQVVSFWAGIDRSPGVDSEQRLLDGIRRTCTAIRAEGLIPSLEPEPGMAVATVAQWRKVASALGLEAPALTLDVGHLLVEDEGDPASICREVAPLLAQVHMEDMRRFVHEHLLPGEGDLDIGAALRGLSAGGYAGPVCFELSRHSHMAPHAVAACKAAWATGR